MTRQSDPELREQRPGGPTVRAIVVEQHGGPPGTECFCNSLIINRMHGEGIEPPAAGRVNRRGFLSAQGVHRIKERARKTTTSSKEFFSSPAGCGNATSDGLFANSGKDERFNWFTDAVANGTLARPLK